MRTRRISAPSCVGDTGEHGEVLCLARTRRQVGKLAWGLREADIPHTGVQEGRWRDWDHPMLLLLRALRAIDRDGVIPAFVAASLSRNVTDISSNEARTEAQRLAWIDMDRDTVSKGDTPPPIGDSRLESSMPVAVADRDRLAEWFPRAFAAEEDGGDAGGAGGKDEVTRTRAIIRQLILPDRKRDLLTDALHSAAENDPDEVRVGTIHAAKGLEAPSVILSPALSTVHLGRYRDDFETEVEERRVFYVGMSRAAECVDVIHGFHGGTEFPPLAAE